MLMEIKNLTYDYPDGTTALRGVDLVLDGTQNVALIGPNGSGKSTLLAHLAGCIAAPKGTLFYKGEEATLEVLHRSVGMVFQDPDDQLFMATALEDVGFGLVARGMKRAHADEIALAQLVTLGGERLAKRPPHRMSGGEKRLVALAGALVLNPDLLVLDEPSSALDPKARRTLITVLQNLEKPFLMTTHDLPMALELCDQVIVLHQGKVVDIGGKELLQDAERLAKWELELM